MTKVLKFLIVAAFFIAPVSHAADTRVGFKNIFLKDAYSHVSKNPALICKVVRNEMPVPRTHTSAELRNLELEVLERRAVTFGEKKCKFKSYNTIAGLYILDSTLQFYGDRLLSIHLNVRLNGSAGGLGNVEERSSLFSALIEGLTDKYGTPETKDFSTKSAFSETKVSRLLWTLENDYVYVDQEEASDKLDISFLSKDQRLESHIRWRMLQKAEDRRDLAREEQNKADLINRKTDF